MGEEEIRADRSGTLEMRRMASNCIANAHRLLSAQTLSDRNVHDARKEIKKSRASVRLLRTALGSARFRRENARLRGVGHALNAARDARVRVRTLDWLAERHRALTGDAVYLALSGQLRDSQRRSRRQLRKPAAGLMVARRTLEQARYSADRWPVGHGGWDKLGPAFRRIYAAGRRAALRSLTQADDHLLHQWRKQVKYLAHALHVFQSLRPSKLGKYAKLAERLAETLGDAHDLALLREAALGLARQQALQAGSLLRAIDRHRGILRKHSLALIPRVYPEPPRVMEKRLQHYWHRWRERAK
jgi:CHAD domain-containing protein